MQTNPELILNERLLPGWLKASMLSACVLFACWGASILYWRRNRANPAPEEMMWWMLGLPLCLLFVFFSGYWLITRRVAASKAVAAAAPVNAASAAPSPVRTAPLAIVGASLRSPHGTSPEELAAAIRKNRARADLDKELVDDNGFPIMSARSREAGNDAYREEIAEWLERQGTAELRFTDEHWRAITLGSAVVSELVMHAVGILTPQATARPMLELMPIVPAEWSTAQRRGAGMWLKNVAAQAGWPADRVVLSGEIINPCDLSLTEAFKHLHANGATPVPLIAVVVAFASYIGEQTVSRWASDGFLFTSSHPQGLIPGEGAAGLLLTNLALARSVAASAFTALDAMEETYLGAAADADHRLSPALLGELTAKSMQTGGIASSDVGMVIADTGLRTKKVLELTEHIAATMPHLDATEDVMRAGVANGSCDIVPFMTALALAHHRVLELGEPVLCISNEDIHRRSTVLVRSLGVPASGNVPESLAS